MGRTLGGGSPGPGSTRGPGNGPCRGAQGCGRGMWGAVPCHGCHAVLGAGRASAAAARARGSIRTLATSCWDTHWSHPPGKACGECRARDPHTRVSRGYPRSLLLPPRTPTEPRPLRPLSPHPSWHIHQPLLETHAASGGLGLDIGKYFFTERAVRRGTRLPGRWGSPQPWGGSKTVWTQHLGTLW